MMTATRILMLVLSLASLAGIANAGTGEWPMLGPAARVADRVAAPLLASAKAGDRVVAVGDHGVILLADAGKPYRQAKKVPFRSLLTTVQFVDERRGFAAGHDGVVLGTQDRGETWQVLRATPGIEQPILSLHFDTPEHGLAVGLFGWAIETRDGGRSWVKRHIGGDRNDWHSFDLFTSPKGSWFIAAEAGHLFRSTDGGESWQTLVVAEDAGSLWHGQALADGTLLVCGMRGHLYRSTDDGQTWQAVDSGTKQSLTSIAQMPDGTVFIVGMEGVVLRSKDSGATFSALRSGQGEPLTSVIAGSKRPRFFSMIGPLRLTGAQDDRD